MNPNPHSLHNIRNVPASKPTSHDPASEVRRCTLPCSSEAAGIRSATFCERALAQVLKSFGALDILVNNAAWQVRQDTLPEITDEQLERTVGTNVLGMFYLTRAALPYIPRGGSIINTGSISPRPAIRAMSAEKCSRCSEEM